MKTSEAMKQAIRRYDDKNTKQYHLKLNLKTDADLIKWISEQGKFQTYVKRLIKADMER